MKLLTIVDYGMGNVGSIANMVKKVGGEAIVTAESGRIAGADKLILPGVGAFDNGMKQLQAHGLIEILRRRIITDRVPVLGICLGMQLLTKSSEEGALPGLGVVDAYTEKFKFDGRNSELKIPHMGWNTVHIMKKSPIFENMYEEPAFYFVHSFHVRCNNGEDILTTTHYGFDFVSSIQRDNIFATQFHPEKSHKYGILFLSNFLRLVS